MTEYLELNGVPLDPVDPALLRATSYGHFTSMQVRDGHVRGLGLHLERLDRSSHELFGHGVAPERSLSYLRSAFTRAASGAGSGSASGLGSGSGDRSIRVTAFSRQGAKVHDGIPVEPDLLVTVTDPVDPTPGTLRLNAVEHERPVPHIKHTGTFSLVHYLRQARLAGFDDALFFDRTGNVSEASIWNICFAKEGRIIWPAAAVLPGITMLVLQGGLVATCVPSETLPVPLTELGSYDAAYLTNSIDAALPVASITTRDGTASYSADPASVALIAKAYAAVPSDPLL